MSNLYTSSSKHNWLQAAAFLSLFLSLLIVVCFIQRQFFKHIFTGEALFLGSEKTVLFVGNSHCERAIDPEVNEHWENIAQHSEPTFFSKYKIETYLKANPQLELIALTFCPVNIRGMDAAAPERATGLMYNRYYYLLDRAGCRQMLGNFNHSLRAFLIYKAGVPLEWHHRTLKHLRNNTPPPFTGGYRPHETRTLDTDSAQRAIARHYHDNGRSGLPISSLQLNSLVQICEMTLDAGVNLILISTPVEDDYYESIPNYIQEQLQAHLIKLQKEYPHLIYIDAQTLLGDSKQYFYDADHLNSEGAKVFSEYLTQTLQHIPPIEGRLQHSNE